MINNRRETLFEQVNGDASLLNSDKLREQMLHNLIDCYLIINQANKLGFTVSDATITQMLMAEKPSRRQRKNSLMSCLLTI